MELTIENEKYYIENKGNGYSYYKIVNNEKTIPTVDELRKISQELAKKASELYQRDNALEKLTESTQNLDMPMTLVRKKENNGQVSFLIIFIITQLMTTLLIVLHYFVLK